MSAGLHPHTVASSSVSVVGMSASPSASVSVMGSEQAAAVESAAGKAIRDKVKEDGGPIPKEVANVSFHLNLYDNVDVTAHVVSIKAGPTGTVLTFWLTSNTIDHAMGAVSEILGEIFILRWLLHPLRGMAHRDAINGY